VSLLRIGLATGLLLLVPLAAMQFTDEVVWTIADFVVAGVLLAGAGSALEVVVRKAHNMAYKAAAGIAVLTALFLVWSNLAVGIIGSEDHAANLLYAGVLAVAVIGSIAARFRAGAMARAMFTTALAQVLVPLIALVIWRPGVTSEDALMAGLDVVGVSGMFVVLWLGAALLFRRADANDSRRGRRLAGYRVPGV
jgi:hypothetical protein